jgi:hypothetical protein
MIHLHNQKYRAGKLKFCFYLTFSMLFFISCNTRKGDIVILIPENATFQERLAAKEVRRYLYVRTDMLLPIKKIQPGQLENKESIIITGLKHYHEMEEQGNLP